MPFVVQHTNEPHDRETWTDYITLLQKHGIDWSNTSRIFDANSARWLYVWNTKAAAEDFCTQLRQKTRDHLWSVVPLSEEATITQGSLVRVFIVMRRSVPSANFRLDPHGKTLVKRRFPQARQLSNIEIQWPTPDDFEQDQSLIWDRVAMMLTGLSLEELVTIDGYQIYDVFADAVVHDTLNLVPA